MTGNKQDAGHQIKPGCSMPLPEESAIRARQAASRTTVAARPRAKSVTCGLYASLTQFVIYSVTL